MTGSMTISATPDIGNVDLASAASIRVARKVLDHAEQQGQAAVQMIQAAAKVAQGASPPGVGERLDVVA